MTLPLYRVTGVVSYTRFFTCDCCGQDTGADETERVDLEINAADETTAASLALEQVIAAKRERYKYEATFSAAEWCDIPMVRQLSEAEKMRRAGAPALF